MSETGERATQEIEKQTWYQMWFGMQSMMYWKTWHEVQVGVPLHDPGFADGLRDSVFATVRGPSE